MYNVPQFIFAWNFLIVRWRLCNFDTNTTEDLLCPRSAFYKEVQYVNISHLRQIRYLLFHHSLSILASTKDSCQQELLLWCFTKWGFSISIISLTFINWNFTERKSYPFSNHLFIPVWTRGYFFNLMGCNSLLSLYFLKLSQIWSFIGFSFKLAPVTLIHSHHICDLDSPPTNYPQHFLHSNLS